MDSSAVLSLRACDFVSGVTSCCAELCVVLSDMLPTARVLQCVARILLLCAPSRHNQAMFCFAKHNISGLWYSRLWVARQLCCSTDIQILFDGIVRPLFGAKEFPKRNLNLDKCVSRVASLSVLTLSRVGHIYSSCAY